MATTQQLESEIVSLKSRVELLEKALVSLNSLVMYERQSHLAVVNMEETFLNMRPTTSEMRKAFKEGQH